MNRLRKPTVLLLVVQDDLNAGAHRPGLVHAECPLSKFLVAAVKRSITVQQLVDGPCQCADDFAHVASASRGSGEMPRSAAAEMRVTRVRRSAPMQCTPCFSPTSPKSSYSCEWTEFDSEGECHDGEERSSRVACGASGNIGHMSYRHWLGRDEDQVEIGRWSVTR